MLARSLIAAGADPCTLGSCRTAPKARVKIETTQAARGTVILAAPVRERAMRRSVVVNEFNRGLVTVSTKVSVSPGEFWAVLRDWAAVLDWVLPSGMVPPSRVFLKEGHHVDVLPCTRVIEASPDQSYSHEETLIVSDPEARRIYYTFNGVPRGMRNYVATTFVDPDGDGGAMVTCSCSFDLPKTASMERMEQSLRETFQVRIAQGIEGAVLARRSGSAPQTPTI